MSVFGPNVALVVAETDAFGALEMTALRPGPAGTSSVSLARGSVTVSVDTASPSDLVALRIEADADPIWREALGVLVGSHFADQISEARIEAGGSRERVEVWRADPATPALRTGGLVAEVGRLALAGTELRRYRSADRTRLTLGLAEAAVLAANLPPALVPEPTPASLVRAALRWLDEPPGARLDPDVPSARFQLHELTSWWSSALEGLGPDAATLADYLATLTAVAGAAAHGYERHLAVELREAAAPPPSSVAAAPAPARAAGGAGHAKRTRSSDRVQFRSFSFRADVSDDASLIGATRSGSDLTVHIGGVGAGALWLRVFAGPLPTLVALAPFDSRPGQWRSATALLPDLSDDELRVDVTGEPAQPWRSPAVVGTERALDLGARAARATRQDAPYASAAWQECASAWKSLGDAQQTSRALRLAREPRPADLEALAVDLLAIDPAV